MPASENKPEDETWIDSDLLATVYVNPDLLWHLNRSSGGSPPTAFENQTAIPRITAGPGWLNPTVSSKVWQSGRVIGSVQIISSINLPSRKVSRSSRPR